MYKIPTVRCKSYKTSKKLIESWGSCYLRLVSCKNRTWFQLVHIGCYSRKPELRRGESGQGRRKANMKVSYRGCCSGLWGFAMPLLTPPEKHLGNLLESFIWKNKKLEHIFYWLHSAVINTKYRQTVIHSTLCVMSGIGKKRRKKKRKKMRRHR